MHCPICGKDNDPDAVYCDECGNKLIKEIKEPVNYFSHINWKAILIGSIIGSVLVIIITFLNYFYLGYIPIPILIGVIIGYITNENWKNGAMNAVIANAIISIIIIIVFSILVIIGINTFTYLSSLFMGIFIIILGFLLLIFFTLMGALGGIIGSYTRKYIKNRKDSI